MIFPHWTDDQFREFRGEESRAEYDWYRAFRDQLDDSFSVFYSVNLYQVNSRNRVEKGEIDFLIFHENFGAILLEVKGGEVLFSTDQQALFTRNGLGMFHIDPVGQLSKCQRLLISKLRHHPAWHDDDFLRIRFAVGFTDAREIVHGDFGLPSEAVGTYSDIKDVRSFLLRVVGLDESDISNNVAANDSVTSRLRTTLGRDYAFLEDWRSRIEQIEASQRKSTVEQELCLELLASQTRVQILGAAGSGKTLLAMRKFQELVDSGLQVLFVVRNPMLATYLRNRLHGGEVLSLERLVIDLDRRAEEESGVRLLGRTGQDLPSTSVETGDWANMIESAVSELHIWFDALIVDEVQDFSEGEIFALRAFLGGEPNAPVYLFGDNNQALDGRSIELHDFPPPYILNRNCRNPAPVFEISKRFYVGPERANLIKDGIPVKTMVGGDIRDQANWVYQTINDDMVDLEKKIDDFVVLVGDIENSAYRSTLNEVFSKKNEESPNIFSVRDYKGLEATIVYLWGIESFHGVEQKEFLYVGVTRCTLALRVVTTSSLVFEG